MKEYEFTLILEDLLDESDEALDRLYEAGCDDGSPATTAGRSYIVFHRKANSLEDAIRSAIANVRAAGFAVAQVETDEFSTVAQVNRELASAC